MITSNFSIRTGHGVLTNAFQDAYVIRLMVFVEEQGIPFDNERDAFDETAYHSVLYIEDNMPVACGRVNFINEYAKVCRIAVLKSYRHKGYASKLCEALIYLAQKKGALNIYLHAQVSVVDLYKNLGFVEIGDIFDEEGIPHIRMERHLTTSGEDV